MKCPKCQTNNKESAKFCFDCGAKLELKCSQCGHSVLPLAKFCEECGHKLSLPPKATPQEAGFDEKLVNIQKYLPGGLTEKILAQRAKIEGERKQVTVLFCDMENFTPLVEKLGHEEAFTLMDKVYEILIHKVHEFEGTVNDLSGDGMMALFGAPIALEDAPQRAIRSALAIHREIAQFSDRMKQEKGMPAIRMRVGIHSGPVVVGALGNDLRVKFTAVGDTVNLASRVQNLAEAGTTYVTGETFKLTEGLFRFESMGERKVKGREEPVWIYQVIAPSTRRTRFDVSAERGLSPFTGRAHELQILLDGLERVKGGRGQAFSILGEAGVGKSRFLYEYRKTISDQDVNVLEGKCLSYGRTVPYHPIIDILKSLFSIDETDTEERIQVRVTNGIRVMNLLESSTVPFILELVSVKDSGLDRISMSPESRKDRITQALKNLILKASEICPLILVVEDLHWIDKASEDVLKEFLDAIPGARVLLIFTYRPEFVHTWGGRSYHSQITLNRLSHRETLSMAAYLLGNELESELQNIILDKTEGVPFFVEEFIRSIRDLGIIEKKNEKIQLSAGKESLPIPSTVQEMIMARVDSLPDGTKAVLQAGSVIEREFPHELIKKVIRIREEELLTHISLLKNRELLYERGVYPRTSYIFRHALTREIVYDSILSGKRKELHIQVGRSMEELHKEDQGEYFAVLAHHFWAGEDYEKGGKYFGLAGRKAEKMASWLDAIAHAKRRVACIEKLRRTNEVERVLIDSRTTLGLYLFQLFLFQQAKKAVAPIIDSALSLGYSKRIAQINTILGAHSYWVEEDFSKAIEYLNRALEISVRAGDIVSQFFAHEWLGYAYCFECEFEKSQYHFESALKINVASKNLWVLPL